MDYKVDYHIHSYYSDGMMSPVELVKKYNEEDYDIISITDHDNIKAFSEAKIAGEALDITVVPGVELSTEYGLTLAADADEQHPAGTEAAIELHLLGYQFDSRSWKKTAERGTKSSRRYLTRWDIRSIWPRLPLRARAVMSANRISPEHGSRKG